MLKIKIDLVDELSPVEEAADSDFDAFDFPLQLEPLHSVAPRFFVGLQHVDDVAPIVFAPDVEQSLDVLDFAQRLDYIRSGVLLNVLNAGVEVVEDVMFDGIHATLVENLHCVATIFFEVIRVGRPADDRFPLLTELIRKLPCPNIRSNPDVVEDDDIGPLNLGAPVVGFWHEPIADFLVALGLNVVLHVVPLAVNLPREVGDQCGISGNK